MVELITGHVGIFLFVTVVPERLLIGNFIVGTLMVVVSGVITERLFSESVEDEEVVGLVVPVRIRFVISGRVVLGTTIVSGEIVRLLVESVLVVEVEVVVPVLRSEGEITTGVLIRLKEKAYTENVRNTP